MIVPSYVEIAYHWNPLMDHYHEMPPLIDFFNTGILFVQSSVYFFSV